MAQKLLKPKKGKIAPGRARTPAAPDSSPSGRARAPREPRVVLVGTCRPGQLERWPDCYNYPLYEGEKLDPESCRRVNELWLFSGTKDRRTFRVECLGVKTREELVRDYGYKARGKGHGDGRYLLFRRIKELYVPAKGEAECVIVRTRDFAGQSKKGAIVQRQLKAYLESPDRKDPLCAKLLPTILTKLPPQTLRVCEAAVHLPTEDFERIPAWGDVKEWPGKVIGCCDYEVRLDNAARESRAVRALWDEGYAYWWELSEVACFDRPIPCRGNVGMWQMSEALAAQVTAALRAFGERLGVRVLDHLVIGDEVTSERELK